MFGLRANKAKGVRRLLTDELELKGEGRKPPTPQLTEDGSVGYVFAVWHDADGRDAATELSGDVSLDKLCASRTAKSAQRRWAALERFAARNGSVLPDAEWLAVEVETA